MRLFSMMISWRFMFVVLDGNSSCYFLLVNLVTFLDGSCCFTWCYSWCFLLFSLMYPAVFLVVSCCFSWCILLFFLMILGVIRCYILVFSWCLKSWFKLWYSWDALNLRCLNYLFSLHLQYTTVENSKQCFSQFFHIQIVLIMNKMWTSKTRHYPWTVI